MSNAVMFAKYASEINYLKKNDERFEEQLFFWYYINNVCAYTYNVAAMNKYDTNTSLNCSGGFES